MARTGWLPVLTATALVLLNISPSLQVATNSCDCVSFRLTNVQDYYLAAHQEAIMNVFHQYQIPLTLGIAGNYFGVDSSLVNSVKSKISDPLWPTELACNGYDYLDYTTLDQATQVSEMTQCSDRIQSIFGKTPVTFIPPGDKLNSDTFAAASTAGYTHVSASMSTDEGPYPMSSNGSTSGFLWRFPSGAYTRNTTQGLGFSLGASAAATWAQIQSQINSTGFSVVDIQPYEYASYDKTYGIYNETSVLQAQLDQLVQLFFLVISSGKRLVLLQDIHSNINVPYYPKCVAFRLDDIQDYYCDAQQLAIMNVFEQYKVPLTIGIIANEFGEDTTVVSAVKAFQKNPGAEIADHGYNHEDFTTFTLSQQSSLLAQAVTKIQNVLGVRVTTFVPPYNSWNANTKTALKTNGFNLMSSEVDQDPGPYNTRTNPPSDGFWRFPIDAQTAVEVPNGNYAPISAAESFAQIVQQVGTYGWSSVMMHPYEFAGQDANNNPIESVVNATQISELNKLVFQTGLKYKLVNLHDLQYC